MTDTARQSSARCLPTALLVLGALGLVFLLWLALGPGFDRPRAIACVATSAVVGVLWVLAGAALVGDTLRAAAVRWLGGAALAAGIGLLVLAIVLLPITSASTWAV